MILVVFAVGLITGSFLNVCIFRLPEGQSVVFPSSHCCFCQKAIGWYDNIPLVSYAVLKGRCRHCRAAISPQYFWIELFTGALFVLFYFYFGVTARGSVYLIFALALLVETAIDFRHQIIPDAITLPGIVLGLVASTLIPGLHGQTSPLWGFVWALAGLLVGGGILYLAGTLAEWILKKEAMGGGDVKLLAMIGTILGWPGVLWTIFVSSLLGSVVGLYVRLTKGQERIPYGPYLAAAAFSYLFIGKQAIQVYLKFMGII